MARRGRRVRIRLTLWFVLLSGGVIAGYIGCAMAILRWQLRAVVERLAVQDVETVEGLLEFLPNGQLDLREDYHTHTQWRQSEQRYLEVLGADGKVLYRNDKLDHEDMGGAPWPSEGVGGYSVRSATLSDGLPVVLVSRRHALDGRMLIVRLGYDKDLYLHDWRVACVALLVTLPLCLLGLALAGFKLSGWVFDPIAAIAATAERINSQSLDERLQVADKDGELADLATVINAMLARIEDAFGQLRHFTADASHQLRTPLAALRTAGEVSLAAGGDAEYYRDTIGEMLEEVGQLSQLVEQLLTLSRADAGQLPLQPSRFDAPALAREVAALLDVLADEKQLNLRVGGDSDFEMLADRALLRQALVNVVHNAIKFTPPRGTVELRVSRGEDGSVRFSVEDTGPGVPLQERTRVFQRFHRSPNRQNEGAGLGLAIAAWVVTAHRGEYGVSSAPGGGCRVWIQIPA